MVKSSLKGKTQAISLLYACVMLFFLYMLFGFISIATRKIYVATAVDGCATIGGVYVTRASLKASGDDCAALGGQVNSINAEFCDIDWCSVTRVISGALYPRYTLFLFGIVYTFW